MQPIVSSSESEHDIGNADNSQYAIYAMLLLRGRLMLSFYTIGELVFICVVASYIFGLYLLFLLKSFIFGLYLMF